MPCGSKDSNHLDNNKKVSSYKMPKGKLCISFNALFGCVNHFGQNVLHKVQKTKEGKKGKKTTRDVI